MKVRLIRERKVTDFALLHARTVADFNDWIYKVRSADWDRVADIGKTFPSTLVRDNKVIFFIGDTGFKIECSFRVNSEIDTFHLIVERVY